MYLERSLISPMSPAWMRARVYYKDGNHHTKLFLEKDLAMVLKLAGELTRLAVRTGSGLDRTAGGRRLVCVRVVGCVKRRGRRAPGSR